MGQRIGFDVGWRAVCGSVPVALCLVLIFALPATAGSGQTPPPDLSGYWEIDPERSDDVSEKLRQALRSQRELERGRGGGRGGFRARPGTGGANGALAERQARLEALAESVRIVSIDHQDPVLELKSGLADSDWALTAYTDGREFERPSPSPE